MANVAIYYQEKEHESTESAIKYINELILSLEINHTIKGVFIDRFDDKSELMEMCNYSLRSIDFLFIEKPLEDDFDYNLIIQVSKAEHFEILYFKEVL